ncbi:MAG: NERD domain-containing protein, partial [Phycisphaerales bacterium]|nr:NERD domain-containing protein [Phycisphaerales bacterium]
GVFVIETKTRSKSVQGNPVIEYDGEHVLVDGHAPDRDPIAQAKACRDHIKSIFSRVTQRDPKLRAVVLFPGWFIRRKAKNVEVWVLNPTAFVKFLKHEPCLLTSEDIGMLSEALETHIRSNRRS